MRQNIFHLGDIAFIDDEDKNGGFIIRAEGKHIGKTHRTGELQLMQWLQEKVKADALHQPEYTSPADAVTLETEVRGSVRLGGKYYRISPLEDNEDALGICRPSVSEIRVAAQSNGRPRTVNDILVTLWHEILHCALSDLGYSELCDNEQLVTALSTLISQAVLTLRCMPGIDGGIE